MKSATVPSFWERYRRLDQDIPPFHPSLRLKCINWDENIWSVRVTLGYRALGVLDEDTVNNTANYVLLLSNYGKVGLSSNVHDFRMSTVSPSVFEYINEKMLNYVCEMR